MFIYINTSDIVANLVFSFLVGVFIVYREDVIMCFFFRIMCEVLREFFGFNKEELFLINELWLRVFYIFFLINIVYFSFFLKV